MQLFRCTLTTLLLLTTTLFASTPPAPELFSTPPLFTGMQGLDVPITPTTDRTKQYFNQGMLFYHGFNFPEAARSFREATRHDPDSAAAHWGEALALKDSSDKPTDEWAALAKAAIRRAELAKNGSPKERELIRILAKYLDAPATEKNSDEIFLNSLGLLADKYPTDPDLISIYALASMHVQAEQDSSEATKYAEAAVKRIEIALADHPKHPGLLHLHIHSLENAGRSKDGLESALILDNLVPGSGHLQHMPAHIYSALGRYHDASEANLRSLAADARLFNEGGLRIPEFAGFYLHSHFFLFQSLAMEGRYEEAIKQAKLLVHQLDDGAIPSTQLYRDIFGAVPYLIITRFGNWSQALQEPAPNPQLLFTTGSWLYMQGMANVNTGKMEQAEKILKEYRAWISKYQKDKDHYDSTLIQLLCLGCLELEGQIAASNGNKMRQFYLLGEAARTEAGLTMHMTPWYMPIRQSLGAALVKAELWEQAEVVFYQDLKINPENGWSLFGLMTVLKKQNKTDEWKVAKAKFDRAWKNADWKLSSSRS